MSPRSGPILNFLSSCVAQAPVTMVAPGYRATASVPRDSLGTTVSSRRLNARMGVNGMASSAAVPKPSMVPAVSLPWNRWNWVSCQGPAFYTYSWEVPLTFPVVGWRHPCCFAQSLHPCLLFQALPYPISYLLSNLISRRWLRPHSWGLPQSGLLAALFF